MTEKEKNEQGIKSVEEYTEYKIEKIKNVILVIGTLATFIISFILTLITNFWLIFIWILIIISENKHKKIKLDEIDKKNIDFYYRDIIENYSICEMSYIDDFEIEEKKDLVAELLYMKKKKLISISDDKIKINENIDFNNINPIQAYILQHVENGKIRNIDIYELQAKVKMQLTKNGELEEKEYIQKKLALKMIRTVILFFIVYFLNMIFANVAIFELLSIIALLILMFYPITSILTTIIDLKKYKADPLYRSNKGKELNKKIEGLRKYIKEYSLLEDKKAEDLAIWEDYLVYSVVFGKNDKIIEQYKKYIEN